MPALHYSVVMKLELSKMAKVSIFKADFVPILTYGYKSWVITESVRPIPVNSPDFVGRLRFQGFLPITQYQQKISRY